MQNKVILDIYDIINSMKNKVIIYQAKNGAIEFRGDFSRETIWATQAQIVELFRAAVTNSNINLFTRPSQIEGYCPYCKCGPKYMNFSRSHHCISIVT